MSKKITKEQFLSRFYVNYPEAQIEVVDYTAISNPAIIRCLKCGKVFTKSRARELYTSFNCCHDRIAKVEKIKKKCQENKDFDFVKKVDKDNIILRHNVCGNEIKRTILSAFDNLESCPYCDTKRTAQLLSIEEVQEKLDEAFFGEIKILDYNGQLKKNHYKCLKCGLIFLQQQTSLMQSRGCPKCDRFQSQGEKQLRKILEKGNITFKEQVGVKELPLQHFDFAIYNNNNLLCYIEVQGEQHREERAIFKDGLQKIQERDQRKRDYCKNNNIELIELIWEKGKFKNLDLLSSLVQRLSP